MTQKQSKLPPGYRLLSYDSIGSTNDEAKRLARGGAAEGTLVWAQEQTAGRGRRGRAWMSPRGNLYLSVIMRPNSPVGSGAQLGFVAALAVGEALRALVPQVEGLAYKWPNDVLLHGRKIAGVLLESETIAPEQPSFVVVGVGVNLAAAPRGTEFPATSIVEEGLATIRPAEMLEEFIRHLRSWLSTWRSEGFEPVRAAWLEAAAIPPGAPIRVRLDSVMLEGRLLDIDHEGSVLLDCAGECRRITAGDVFPAV